MTTTAKLATRPRRRPVPRHPGIYYRPRADNKVGPPYELCYLDSTGTRRWQVIHGNLDVAEARRAELRLRRRRGQRIEPSRQTFEQYANEWLERQTVRPRTIEIYRWALNHHLTPFFGRRRLDQIDAEDIAAFIAHMQRKKLKGWTITSALRPLSIILAQATRKGRIPLNPFSQLERGERPRHDDQRPKRILTLDEMRALLAHADQEIYRCLLELLLTSGLRIGEALGLTVNDLDPEHNLLRVEYQLGRDGTRTPLKTDESRRAVDIPPQLMRRLLALVGERGDRFNPQAFVFATHNGSGLERKVARNALDRASKAAQLAAPKPTLHDLRHSHASMLIALDYNLVDIQRRLGHRKPDTTLRVYAHEWKYREAQRSQIGNHLDRLFNPPERPALPAPARDSPRLALPARS
ncbi:MAG: tyrosine-type recombinase/integrase [Solirubrobacteraceae bacterium]